MILLIQDIIFWVVVFFIRNKFFPDLSVFATIVIAAIVSIVWDWTYEEFFGRSIEKLGAGRFWGRKIEKRRPGYYKSLENLDGFTELTLEALKYQGWITDYKMPTPGVFTGNFREVLVNTYGYRGLLYVLDHEISKEDMVRISVAAGTYGAEKIIIVEKYKRHFKHSLAAKADDAGYVTLEDFQITQALDEKYQIWSDDVYTGPLPDKTNTAG